MSKRLAIAVAVGAIAGGLLGYYGQCTTGTCPLTANPWRGAVVGAVFGLLFGLSGASQGRREAVAGADGEAAGDASAPGAPSPAPDAISETVVVLGASPNPERYSHQAVRLLAEYGHRVIPVHPTAAEIAGMPAVASLPSIKDKVDTLTMYVNPERSAALAAEILALAPRRIIFNPGTENPALAARCRERGMAVSEACTLVLLRTGQFGQECGGNGPCGTG